MKKCSARQVQSQSIEVNSKGPDEDAVKEILLHLLKLLPANSHKEVMSAQLGILWSKRNLLFHSLQLSIFFLELFFKVSYLSQVTSLLFMKYIIFP